MTSTSTQIVFPARVIGQLRSREIGWEAWPSHARRVMVEGANSGDPSCFQTEVDITYVDSPSSMIQWEMLAFRILTGIWKVTEAGRGGCSDWSKSKMIKRSSEDSAHGS